MLSVLQFLSFLETMDNTKEVRIGSFKLPYLYHVKFYRDNKVVLFFTREKKTMSISTTELIKEIKGKFDLKKPLINNPMLSCVIINEDNFEKNTFSLERELDIGSIYFNKTADAYILKIISNLEKLPTIEDLEQWYFIDEKMTTLVYKTEKSSFILTKGVKRELILKEIDNLTMVETLEIFPNLEMLSKKIKPPVKTMLKMLKFEVDDA